MSRKEANEKETEGQQSSIHAVKCLSSIERKAAILITGMLRITAADVWDIHANLLPMKEQVEVYQHRAPRISDVQADRTSNKPICETPQIRATWFTRLPRYMSNEVPDDEAKAAARGDVSELQDFPAPLRKPVPHNKTSLLQEYYAKQKRNADWTWRNCMLVQPLATSLPRKIISTQVPYWTYGAKPPSLQSVASNHLHIRNAHTQ
ncbi:uncharacterized protein BT62DRAFT_1075249 [Guyanagaster necrorhizus]|uniref:Uncharacterized protein n=1 Tax=Guyanagaster necrorhizus TaxID=856835 RepID=A0A9P8ATM4_9AGAR|nr:uncharacterized protein BT62DRAFT_1075249 [Guyanagaster necrorhizus MCA 3950]KAG7447156.1 hypothetical protein BT62DRAFT_1075249 [Guyanagaster necrorhizus MCA 3950]